MSHRSPTQVSESNGRVDGRSRARLAAHVVPPPAETVTDAAASGLKSHFRLQSRTELRVLMGFQQLPIDWKWSVAKIFFSATGNPVSLPSIDQSAHRIGDHLSLPRSTEGVPGSAATIPCPALPTAFLIPRTAQRRSTGSARAKPNQRRQAQPVRPPGQCLADEGSDVAPLGHHAAPLASS